MQKQRKQKNEETTIFSDSFGNITERLSIKTKEKADKTLTQLGKEKAKEFFQNSFDVLIKPTVVGLSMGLLALNPWMGALAFGMQLGADYAVKKGKLPGKAVGDGVTALGFGILSGFPSPLTMVGAAVFTAIAQYGGEKVQEKHSKKNKGLTL